jgi:hypothetical protein
MVVVALVIAEAQKHLGKGLASANLINLISWRKDQLHIVNKPPGTNFRNDECSIQ